MVKIIKSFNLDAFNYLISIMSKGLFSQTVVFTERCRKCAGCKYLGIDYKCAKSDCKFYKTTLFNTKGKCPIQQW